jgi:hypothetical protein
VIKKKKKKVADNFGSWIARLLEFGILADTQHAEDTTGDARLTPVGKELVSDQCCAM